MISARAPGKLILMGEHAAVYGRPAIVGVLDLAIEVTVEAVAALGQESTRTPGSEPSVELDLDGAPSKVSWAEIDRFVQRAREHWRSMMAADQARFEPLEAAGAGVDRRNRLVVLALGEARLAARSRVAATTKDLELRLSVRSRLPIGSGFGSSAALSAAVAAAFLAQVLRDPPDSVAADRATTCLDPEDLNPENLDPENLDPENFDPGDYDLESLGLDIERHQHGTPSGVDSTAVVRGGVLWIARPRGAQASTVPAPASPLPPETTPAIETIEDPGRLIDRIQVWDTGAPQESTGEVVSAVRALRRTDLPRFERGIDQIENATRAFRRALEAGDGSALAASLRLCESGLETVGVVPEAVKSTIRAIERAGAAAKISGAGATEGTSAGALLVYDPGPGGSDGGRGASAAERRQGQLAEILQHAGYVRIEATLGGAGVAVAGAPLSMPAPDTQPSKSDRTQEPQG